MKTQRIGHLPLALAAGLVIAAATLPAQEPMGKHPGPRSSPAVVAGKLVFMKDKDSVTAWTAE